MKSSKRIIITFSILCIILSFYSCSNRNTSEIRETIEVYDKAVKNGDLNEIKKYLSDDTLMVIKSLYQDENEFFSILINEEKEHKNEPPPKIKNIEEMENERFRVRVELFNREKKTLYLLKENNEWKIDILYQVNKLNEIEKNFRK